MPRNIRRRQASHKGFTFHFSGLEMLLVSISLLVICFLCFSLGVMGGFYLSNRSIKSQLPTEEEINRHLSQKRPPEH